MEFHYYNQIKMKETNKKSSKTRSKPRKPSSKTRTSRKRKGSQREFPANNKPRDVIDERNRVVQRKGASKVVQPTVIVHSDWKKQTLGTHLPPASSEKIPGTENYFFRVRYTNSIHADAIIPAAGAAIIIFNTADDANNSKQVMKKCTDALKVFRRCAILVKLTWPETEKAGYTIGEAVGTELQHLVPEEVQVIPFSGWDEVPFMFREFLYVLTPSKLTQVKHYFESQQEQDLLKNIVDFLCNVMKPVKLDRTTATALVQACGGSLSSLLAMSRDELLEQTPLSIKQVDVLLENVFQ